MELSTTADWLGVIAGCALGLGWIRRFYQWLRSKLTHAAQMAERGGELVAELLENATSPARRADIHAYVHFRSIEIEARHTRQLVLQLAFGLSIGFLGLLFVALHRLFDTSYIPWLWWIAVANYASLCVAFAMALFFGWQLRRVESAWQERAGQVLCDRAARHVSGSEV